VTRLALFVAGVYVGWWAGTRPYRWTRHDTRLAHAAAAARVLP
jgi:hypothetical protein